MLTNSCCTIYSREYNPSKDYDEWKKRYIPECWWFCQSKSSITTDGLKSGDVLTVRIPDLSVKVKKGDVIVQGYCNVDMKTVKDLEKCDYYKVTSVNYNRFGSEPHIKVVGA